MAFKKAVKYIPAFLFLAAVALNAVAWNSTSFCDFYASHIFPVIVETYGRFSGQFSFSLGEWMLVAAFLMVAAVPGGGMVCLAGRRLFPWYRRYLKVFGTIAAVVCLVMTLNCFILYHCSPITDLYVIGKRGEGENGGREGAGEYGEGGYGEGEYDAGENGAGEYGAGEHSAGENGEGEYGVGEHGEGKYGKREYGVEELTLLRDFVVTRANELAEQLPRDENGYVDEKAAGDMISRAREEMKRLGEIYPRLSGYYPEPKPFFGSRFFSQQNIMGYYFPFSMEANYNEAMYVVNKPATLCHELSHLKGFIYEDEANFIGYLACVDSEDPLFRYSAYLSVIGYLDQEFFKAVEGDADVYRSHPAVSDLVMRDDIFLTAEAWEQVEETALFDTELVREVSGEIVETNLTLNGVSDGMASYGRVVGLLLEYYDGKLW